MPMESTQRELLTPPPLLDAQGRLSQVGSARQPLLDCNLKHARFYRLRAFQPLRLKRWDYYGLTTPTHFYSATLAHLGYLGQVFAYVIDLNSGDYHEETLTIPLGRGIALPRNSTEGESTFDNGRVRMAFRAEPDGRRLSLSWPGFAEGKGLSAEVRLSLPSSHESMAIVIPIAGNRFYYNRKVNCMPAEGWAEFAGERETIRPDQCLGNLDWGRGVWEYRSFWVWASASGYLPDGRTLGLNLGCGFGDTSAATENALILNGRIHKLAGVDIAYTSGDFMCPWRMTSPDARLDLEFVPFKERVAKIDLKVLSSEVHQMFGRYRGKAQADEGELLRIEGLIGFAEEHHAKW